MLDRKFLASRTFYFDGHICKEDFEWFDISGTMVEHYCFEDQKTSVFESDISEITNISEHMERVIYNQLERFSEYMSDEEGTKERNLYIKKEYVGLEFIFKPEVSDDNDPQLYIEIDNTLVETSEWIQNLISTVEKVSEIEGGQIKQYCDSEIIDGMLVIYNGKRAVV
jgi:hypothetical protein